MSVLILDVGASSVDVGYAQAQEGAPAYVGQTSISFNGAERNSIRAAARTFGVTTIPLDAATEQQVRTAIGNAAPIPCSGDLFNNGGATVTCSWRLTARVPVIGTSYWRLTLAGRVVTAA